MALSREDKKDVKNHLGKALANKVSKATRDRKPFGSTARHPSGRKWRNDDKGTAFESGPYPKAN